MIVHEQEFIPLKVTSIGVFRLSPIHEDTLYTLLDSDRFDLMQYTGLKDKSGVEIWEGDIITDGLSPRVIQFEQTNKTSYGHGDSSTTLHVGYTFHFYGSEVGEIEVIGNIHENPDKIG